MCTHALRGALLAIALLAVGPVGSAAAAHKPKSYSAADAQWLTAAIEGDRFEISGGKTAQSKGGAPDITALGARLQADHSKALAAAKKLARTLGIAIPPSPSPSEQWELDMVATLSGSSFDHWYALLEVQDHHQDIQEADDEIDHAKSSAVRSLARTDLAMYRVHLKLSKAALSTHHS
jgi:putative membrane protein